MGFLQLTVGRTGLRVDNVDEASLLKKFEKHARAYDIITIGKPIIDYTAGFYTIVSCYVILPKKYRTKEMIQYFKGIEMDRRASYLALPFENLEELKAYTEIKHEIEEVM